jgi:prevent-host-death family protein
MVLKEDIRPISYVKAKAAMLLEQINHTHRPVIITQNGEAKAVLQDPESYDKTRKTLAILTLIARGELDAARGKISDQEEVFARLEKKLYEKQKLQGKVD